MGDIAYRYGRFQRELLYHDMALESGPEPCEKIPDFGLATTDAGRVTLPQGTPERPMFMVFPSFS